MKHTPPTPIGISRPPACWEASGYRDPQPVATLPPVLSASEIRRQARILLALPGKEHRLQLVLAEICVIFLSLAAPMMLECLSFLIYTLPYFTGMENLTWLVVLRGVLWGANALLICLPLLGGLYRMAVLMVRTPLDAADATEAAEAYAPIRAWECLYPFTSWHAYTRTLYVGIRALCRLILMLLPPAAVLGAAVWGLPLLGKICPLAVCALLWILAIAAACLSFVGMALWNARGAGFAYGVFAHPEVGVPHLASAFKRTQRNAVTPLLMRLSLLGWCLLSLLAVLVPLLFHAVPYMLLSEAVYGRSLEDRCILNTQENDE